MIENVFSLDRLDHISEEEVQLSSDNTRTLTTRECTGSVDQSETSKTMANNVLMFMEDPTLREDMFIGGHATTEPTKDGPLTLNPTR